MAPFGGGAQGRGHAVAAGYLHDRGPGRGAEALPRLVGQHPRRKRRDELRFVEEDFAETGVHIFRGPPTRARLELRPGYYNKTRLAA